MHPDLLSQEYEHEQLSVFRDPSTAGAIAIRLARAMSLKSAAAGPDLALGDPSPFTARTVLGR